MIAEFKIQHTVHESGEPTIRRIIPWEDTPVHLTIEMFDLLSEMEQTSSLSITGLQRSRAEVIGRDLGRQFETKVRWNWTNSDQGYYVEKEEFSQGGDR